MHDRRTAVIACLVLAALTPSVAAAATGAAAATRDPWAELTAVREGLLAGGPTEADFTQSYVPAGFSSGEEESGRLALHLPDCLRWDYRDPYPKSFLLCGGEAFYWNPEDKSGRRYPVDRSQEPGLDLLLLSVDQLRERYRATTETATPDENGEGGGGRIAVVLEPLAGAATDRGIAGARLVVDPATRRLVELSYRDREGNLSRFVISGYRPLAADGLFSPPDGIAWQDG